MFIPLGHPQQTAEQFTDKKEIKFSSYMYKKIQLEAVAKSYMKKGFQIYMAMRKYLVICEEAVTHI